MGRKIQFDDVKKFFEDNGCELLLRMIDTIK
jgi:hypothetical protein